MDRDSQARQPLQARWKLKPALVTAQRPRGLRFPAGEFFLGEGGEGSGEDGGAGAAGEVEVVVEVVEGGEANPSGAQAYRLIPERTFDVPNRSANSHTAEHGHS